MNTKQQLHRIEQLKDRIAELENQRDELREQTEACRKYISTLETDLSHANAVVSYAEKEKGALFLCALVVLGLGVWGL